MRRASRSVVVSSAAIALFAACRGATDIRVTTTSEVDCVKNARVALLVASGPEGLANAPPSAVSTRCAPNTAGSFDTGTVVLTPASSNDEPIALAVMTRPDGEDPASCGDPAQAKSCIIARRQLRFSPHDDLALPIDLRLSCLGVTCPPAQTCRKGECVTAVVPLGCAYCGEASLGPSAAPVCGDMSGLQPNAPWPMPGYCGTRPGRSGRLGPRTGAIRWKFKTGGIASMDPAVDADGVVYIGSNDRNVYAIDKNGSQLWVAPVGGNVNDTGVVVGRDGNIYVGASDGNVYAFGKGGSKLWATGVQSDVALPPAIAPDGTLYVTGVQTAAPVQLFALAPSGAVRWQVPGPFGSSGATLATDGTLYVGGSNGSLLALRPADGSTVWSAPAGGALSTPSVGDDGTVYVTDTSALHAFDPSGQKKWSVGVDGHSRGVAIAADGTIYVGTVTGTLFAVHPGGKIVWQRPLPGIVQPPTVGADGVIYVGAGDGALYAIAPGGAQLFSAATGGSINAQPAIGADGTLYVVSSDSYLYAIGP